MATRNFLLNEDLAEGRDLLLQGVSFPSGVREARELFSAWLEGKLLRRLEEFGDFRALQPILLGSWSRHELSPKSDIDLLFAGPEDKVGEFIGKAFKAGIKLRARTPENADNWSIGVEPFDVLALHAAIAYEPEGARQLSVQREHAVNTKKEIYKAIKKEREERRVRQDSISNYLEPNLKYGAGGLRDIEQALALKKLFPKAFTEASEYPFELLGQIKEELLYLRSLLHLAGSNDVLSAHDQLELSKTLGLDSSQALMKFVQTQLERASFYADWAVAYSQSSPKKRAQARDGIEDAAKSLSQLRADACLLRQYEVRMQVDDLGKQLSEPEKGKLLHKALYEDQPDDFLVALHRTRWLEVLIPDFKKLKGHVQHDHYHRFTADAHLVQTLREVQRAKTSKRIFGVITKLNKDLTQQDWWTLKLTALFHDLAKGRKGDHSTEGAKLVEQYFEAWKYPEALKNDVHWLVENHLLMSTAAFRQNPQAQSTWKRLFARGVEGKRLLLLALFTAIDIRATNPEAWTPWKAQLLFNLVENLRSPEAKSLNEHLNFARKKKMKEAEEWLLAIDPLLLQMISPTVLLTDLKEAKRSSKDLSVKVLTKDKRVWVRFHRKLDEPGLFAGFVQRLFGLGLSIQLSSVQTLDGVGVYDWFCLRTEKPARQIAKWLALEAPSHIEPPQVQFQSIDVMSQEEEEWILSFRGRDQRGLLFAAASALTKEGSNLRWARAHTWGNQVEDVFSIRPFGEVEPLLERLRRRLVT